MDKSNKEDDFDPFNPKLKDKSSDDKISKTSNDDINILYITGAIIVLIILVWVIVLIMTRNGDTEIEILSEMSKINNQTKLAVDKK